MTKFSTMLELLISNSKTNKYKLCKDYNIDRTTLHRAMNGERIPKEDFVRKLCGALKISPQEERILMELYNIAKVGEPVFERRMFITKLINHISELRLIKNEVNIRKGVLLSEINDLIKTVSGNYNVNSLVRNILENEIYNNASPHIRLNVPFDYVFLFDNLRQLYYENKGKIKISHIAAFIQDADLCANKTVNLEILSNIMPFVFCSGEGYSPHYYYTNTINHQSTFMPYYVCTSCHLLLLSADFKTATLITDRNTIQTYRAAFDEFFINTTPLLEHYTELPDIIDSHVRIFSNTIPEVFGIEAQPCFAEYFTEDIIGRHLRYDLPGREMIRQTLNDYWLNLWTAPTYSYFSVEGLETFVETGRTPYTPPQFSLPFDKAAQKHFLESLREDISRKNNLSRVVNPSKLNISPNISVQIFIDGGTMFSVLTEEGMVYCLIKERSIYDAFTDFFHNLHTSDLAYSKEETLDILDSFIARTYTGESGGN